MITLDSTTKQPAIQKDDAQQLQPGAQQSKKPDPQPEKPDEPDKKSFNWKLWLAIALLITLLGLLLYFYFSGDQPTENPNKFMPQFAPQYIPNNPPQYVPSQPIVQHFYFKGKKGEEQFRRVIETGNTNRINSSSKN